MNSFEKGNLTGKNHDGPNANRPVTILTASSIIGDKVENLQNETLGEINNLMINVQSGKVEYVIVEHGGFLGMGEKLFAIPFEQLELDPVKEVYILNRSIEFFEKAPGFDNEHWPDTNSHAFEKANTYWGSFMGVNTGS